MSRKSKCYLRKPIECYSVTFHDDGDKGIGTMLVIEFCDGKFSMEKVNWGTEEDVERSRDGEVEMTWIFDDENTQKLMLRTGTHNGKELIEEMNNRFRKHKNHADEYIERFCEEKEITYRRNVHY